jgi:hypothetical protein
MIYFLFGQVDLPQHLGISKRSILAPVEKEHHYLFKIEGVRKVTNDLLRTAAVAIRTLACLIALCGL